MSRSARERSVAGAAIVFLPIGWELNRFIVWLYYWLKGTVGITWLSIPQWDFALNALLFAMPAFLAKIAWPRVPVWLWLPFWLLVSIGIEAVQYFNLPRDASVIDIAANSLGALVGILAGAVVRFPASRSSLIDRARTPQ